MRITLYASMGFMPAATACYARCFVSFLPFRRITSSASFFSRLNRLYLTFILYVQIFNDIFTTKSKKNWEWIAFLTGKFLASRIANGAAESNGSFAHYYLAYK